MSQRAVWQRRDKDRSSALSNYGRGENQRLSVQEGWALPESWERKWELQKHNFRHLPFALTCKLAACPGVSLAPRSCHSFWVSTGKEERRYRGFHLYLLLPLPGKLTPPLRPTPIPCLLLRAGFKHCLFSFSVPVAWRIGEIALQSLCVSARACFICLYVFVTSCHWMLSNSQPHNLPGTLHYCRFRGHAAVTSSPAATFTVAS